MFRDLAAPALPEACTREEMLAAMAAPAQAQGGNPLASLTGILGAVDYEQVSPQAGVTVRDVQIASSPDGNTINLQIISPEGRGPWPCVYYIHGGGMAMLSCYDANYRAWGRLIAHQGVKVVMVDFRNALIPSSVPEVAPFPAGLDDCVSGLRWLRSHAADLDVDPARIVVAGDSGGGNLTIAVALRLKRDGDLAGLAGLYALCPMIGGTWPAAPGSSALRNAGLLMDLRSDFAGVVYGVEELRSRNPLAWPGFATEADLAGLPPTVINVNEFDPLLDDGLELYRKLLNAGVSVRCRQQMGTVHATEIFVVCCPDVSLDVARDLAAFCAG
jgi:acetyl esterase/lipase